MSNSTVAPLAKIIDISVPIVQTSPEENEARFYNGPRTYYESGELYVKISVISKYQDPNRDRTTSRLDAPVHTATHIDAPLHRVRNGKNLDDIDLEIFVGKMKVIDVELRKGDVTIEDYHLGSAAGSERTIQRLMIRTGWYKKLGTSEYYSEFAPHLSTGAVRWIVSRGVKLLATDFVIDSSKEPELPLQRSLLESGVCILANLANLGKITTYD